ncbi:MAG: ABC transporter substrate-binding protein [Anaerolineae bacterium]
MKSPRFFMKLLGLTLLALAVAACQPQVVEVVKEVEVIKEVEVEVVKEVEVEVTVETVRIEEVEKEIQVTVEVEVAADYVPEGTLSSAHSVNHINWDPHKDQRTISLHYLNPVFEGLLREANDGRSFIPELATGWEEDETGVTFTLREGVTFHDGTPFNADAVVANLERVKEVGHPVNRGFLKNVVSAEAIDDLTVRYNYSEFDGTVLLTLSRFAGKMLAPSSFETVSDNNPVGTGPYVYNADKSNPDNTFKVYDFNPDYWNTNAQPVAQVEITTVTDQATSVNALLAEEFHTIQVSAIPLIGQLEAAGMVNSSQPAVAWSAHILDRTGEIVPELADERVRRAMSFALDRDAYWQVLNFGAKSTQHALPGGYAYNEDIEDLNLNMEKALELMAEAGNPTFTVDVPSFGPFNARNAFLASSWEPLGITINIIEVNNIFSGCTQAEGVFPIGICPINERHIKHFVENRLLPDGFLNPYGHIDEEIIALHAEAAPLPLAEAEPIYAEIAKISAEKGYIIHLGWAASPVQYDPSRISGVDVRFIYPGTYNVGDVSLNQ